MGMLAALLEAGKSGKGQVIDAAIVDGTTSMATFFYGMVAAGKWHAERGHNVLDSGAYFYNVYECADGKWISVGPIEARFHAELLERMGIDPAQIGAQHDPQPGAGLAKCSRRCSVHAAVRPGATARRHRRMLRARALL